MLLLLMDPAGGDDPGGTIVNLGDLTPAGFSKRRLQRLSQALGRKVLVLGKQDTVCDIVSGVAQGPSCWSERLSTLRFCQAAVL